MICLNFIGKLLFKEKRKKECKKRRNEFLFFSVGDDKHSIIIMIVMTNFSKLYLKKPTFLGKKAIRVDE